jgi:hypothetical protein
MITKILKLLNVIESIRKQKSNSACHKNFEKGFEEVEEEER